MTKLGRAYARLWALSFDDTRIVRMFFARLAILALHAAIIATLFTALRCAATR